MLDADLSAQPDHHVKFDIAALERNHATLQDGLGAAASLTVDKVANAGVNKHCAFCGETGVVGSSYNHAGIQINLKRCACKAVYYCTKEHQKLHWREHKQACSARPSPPAAER